MLGSEPLYGSVAQAAGVAVGVGVGVGVGVCVGVPVGAVYSSRLGEPVPGLVTTPARCVGDDRAGDLRRAWPRGWRCRISAAAPATCGVAIEVPLIVFVAVSAVCQDDVMLEPGAKRSTQVPKFENEARASVDGAWRRR